MEVRSNVVNQVRLLRSNTFADPLAFVDELVQNAQRAGAENLDITVEDDRISFRDDGTGLGEGGPEKLFTPMIRIGRRRRHWGRSRSASGSSLWWRSPIR